MGNEEEAYRHGSRTTGKENDDLLFRGEDLTKDCIGSRDHDTSARSSQDRRRLNFERELLCSI